MKKLSLIFLIFIATISCSKSENNEITSNSSPAIIQTTTSLEGNWLLQNIPNGAKLNFTNSNFTINSGTVTIKGTFTLINNQLNGQVVSRSGANNGGLQPDTFTGNVAILNNRATFTNFSGNWNAVFSTWYGKQ